MSETDPQPPNHVDYLIALMAIEYYSNKPQPEAATKLQVAQALASHILRQEII